MPRLPQLAAVILAAGRSTRMGALNKLTVEVGGQAMVRHAAEAALASRARPVLVVVGHQAQAVRAALAGLDVTFVDNPTYALGLSSSLKRGIRALPAQCEGALILLGDMPGITASHLERLMAAFTPGAIVVPTHGDRRGNPVLWPAVCFAPMLRLRGDAGAKRLLARYQTRVREVDLASAAIFADVDTPEALRRLTG